MNKYIILLISIFFSSCCGKHTEVKYEYNGVEITRVDKCAETTFYYGGGQDENGGLIWAEYSGINDGFSGYLIFEANGKVVVHAGDGYFQSKDLDTNLFELDDTFYYEAPSGKSVYYINLATRHEEENKRNKESAVKASYKRDENEWW